MPRLTSQRIAAYIGVFAACLVVAIGVFAGLAIADAPEELAMWYLEPGAYLDALLIKTGSPYSALLGALNNVFSEATVFGLSLKDNAAMWFPVALAFIVWAFLLTTLIAVVHWLVASKAANAL